MSRRDNERDFEKVLVVSDLHGYFCELKDVSCVLQAATEHPFDIVYINGDLMDLPMMMGEGRHKFNAEEDDLTLDEEIDFTVENILKPLRKAVGKKAKIIFKPGNHEDRLFRVISNNSIGLMQLVIAGTKRDRMKLASMLRFEELGIIMDRGERKDGHNTDVSFIQKRGDRGALIHGHLTAKSRLKTYLTHFLSSGTSGHTHKMEMERLPWYGGVFTWVESGCLCRKTGVTYLPIGKDPGWQHAFVTSWRNKYDGALFLKQHEIKDYSLEFKGTIYTPA